MQWICVGTCDSILFYQSSNLLSPVTAIVNIFKNCTLKLFGKTGLSLYMDHDDNSIMGVDAGGGFRV